METGHDEPQAFDVIALLLLGGGGVVAGDESVAFAPEIADPSK